MKGAKVTQKIKTTMVATMALIAMLLFTIPAFAASNNQAFEKNNGKRDRAGEIRFNQDYNTAEVVKGHFQVTSGSGFKEKALDFIAERNDAFKINNPFKELEPIFEKSDKLGKTHVGFRQVYNGVPIWGTRTVAHFDDSTTIYMVAGQTVPTPQIDVTANIDDATASSHALNALDKTLNNKDLQTQSELVIYPFDKALRLGRLVTVTSPTDGSIRWLVFVDAKTGEVIDKFNNIHFDGPDTGSGPDVLNVNQTFPIYLYSGNYIMWDVTRPTYIFTYEDYYDGGPISTDPDGDKIWDDNNGQKAAVSGQVNAGLTIDYFNNTFGWNSFDDMGSDLIVNVHEFDRQCP